MSKAKIRTQQKYYQNRQIFKKKFTLSIEFMQKAETKCWVRDLD